MKKILFLGACLVALASSPVLAQTGGPQAIAVRVTFNGTRLLMAISRGEGKTETTQVDVPISQLKNQVPIAEAYQHVVEKLAAEGYVLRGMTGDPAYTMLIFTKGQ